jgi:hypothetical protein
MGRTEMKHGSNVSITLEAIDSGDNMPTWLSDALQNGSAG